MAFPPNDPSHLPPSFGMVPAFPGYVQQQTSQVQLHPQHHQHQILQQQPNNNIPFQPPPHVPPAFGPHAGSQQNVSVPSINEQAASPTAPSSSWINYMSTSMPRPSLPGLMHPQPRSPFSTPLFNQVTTERATADFQSRLLSQPFSSAQPPNHVSYSGGGAELKRNDWEQLEQRAAQPSISSSASIPSSTTNPPRPSQTERHVQAPSAGVNPGLEVTRPFPGKPQHSRGHTFPGNQASVGGASRPLVQSVLGAAAAMSGAKGATGITTTGQTGRNKKPQEKADYSSAHLSTPRQPLSDEQKDAAKDDLAQNRVEAKRFILALHKAGYTFEQLVAEDLDAPLLKEIYDELGLRTGITNSGEASIGHLPGETVSSQPPVSPKGEIAAEAVKGSRPAPLRKTAAEFFEKYSERGSALPKPSSQRPADEDGHLPTSTSNRSQPQPLDRESYVARLMAAKTKKSAFDNSSDGSSGNSAPQAAPSTIPIIEDVAMNGDAVEAAAREKRKAQTELALKRMEELSAKRKAAQKSTTKSTSSGVSAPAEEQSSVTQLAASGFQQHIASPQAPQDPDNGQLAPNTSTSSYDQAKLETPTPRSFDAKEFHQDLQSASRIPGLFMTGPIAPRTSDETSAPIGSGEAGKSRSPMPFYPGATKLDRPKRPASSDFEEAPIRKGNRPFGQSPANDEEDVIIIEASDDETAPSEEMERKRNKSRPTANNNSFLPSSSAHTRLQSTLLTGQRIAGSPAAKTEALPVREATPPLPGKDIHQREDYLKRQMDIIDMKKKIAMLELKRKEARALSSRSGTPATPKANDNVAVEVAQPGTMGIDVGDIGLAPLQDFKSAAPEAAETYTSNKAIETSMEPSTSHKTSAASVQSAHSEENRHMNVTDSSADWKKRRREEIKSNLPTLDASFASNSTKMEMLREQMKQLEAALKQDQEGRERLIQELESLGMDTEGIPDSELQATRDQLIAQSGHDQMDEDLNVPNEEVEFDKPSTHSPDKESPSSMSMASVEEDSKTSEQEIIEQTNDYDSSKSRSSGHDAGDSMEDVDHSNESYQDTGDLEAPGELDEVAEEDEEAESEDLSDNLLAEEGEILEEEEEESGEDEAEENERDVEEAVESHSQNSTADVAMSETESGEVSSHAEDSTFDHGASSVQNDGANKALAAQSQNSSSSPEDSDEYEPDDTATHQVSQGRPPRYSLPAETEESEPSHETTLRSNEALALESAAYEPSGKELAPAGLNDASAESDDGYDPPDAVPASSTSESFLQSQTKSITGLDRPLAEQQDYGVSTRNDVAVADDLATELQPSSLSMAGVDSKSGSSDPDRYAPYKSALKDFKAYRFHPDFSSTVPGGFRSATYAHNIDAQLALCPFEAAGGTCNDPKCNMQHFGSMHVEDEIVLRELVTSNPGRTMEERTAFTDGMRVVLNELRETNTVDTEIIASAVAAYHRRFLNDPSRDPPF